MNQYAWEIFIGVAVLCACDGCGRIWTDFIPSDPGFSFGQ
jgi:hypothetical protein